MWRVLVVDDNVVNRQLLIEVLDGQGQCDSAANGREAVEAHGLSVREGNPYDVILLDIAMPEMDGIECLKIIWDNEKAAGIMPGKGVVIFMVTAFDKPFMQAFNGGCDDYILKPIDGNDVLAKIRSKLASRKK